MAASKRTTHHAPSTRDATLVREGLNPPDCREALNLEILFRAIARLGRHCGMAGDREEIVSIVEEITFLATQGEQLAHELNVALDAFPHEPFNPAELSHAH